MKAIFSRIAFAAATVALALSVQSCRQASSDDQYEEQARTYTDSKCPLKVSEEVVLDSMVYSRALRCISYYYTVSGKLDDAKLVQTNVGMLKGAFVKSIKNSVELKRPKDEGINFRHVYSSAKTKTILTSFTLRKSDYEQ